IRPLFAAVFGFLLSGVNYQTFSDPFVVILALPATFCGIVTMLYITDTTLSVPSLMGAIMAVGVASANSILLVTFAREQQLAGMSAFDAAIAAGRTRIRPVLMTAAAMIVGMIPMAIGGPGEEQNAALARAVIGGLLFATPTTLLIVPYLFAILRNRHHGQPRRGATAGQHHDFVPSVRVAAVQANAGTMSVTLPATTNAFKAANIYARASGYVADRKVDIGSHVKVGELLAVITAPELDHQIAQAEA